MEGRDARDELNADRNVGLFDERFEVVSEEYGDGSVD